MEDYIQILLPLYSFSTDLQSDKAHIGLVITALLLLIYETLDRMDLKDENQNQFRNEYLVAAILNVGYLPHWCKSSFALKFFQTGLDNIIELLMKYSANDDEFEKTHGRITKTDKIVSFTGSSDDLSSMRNRPRFNSGTHDLSIQTKRKIL